MGNDDPAFADKVWSLVSELSDNDLTTKQGRVEERKDRAFLSARRRRAESTWLKQALIVALLGSTGTAALGVLTWFLTNYKVGHV